MGKSSTSYSRKWRLGKTTVIRVPEALAGTLLDIAQKIDDRTGTADEDPSAYWSGPFVSVPRRLETTKPVNVSSVAQLSPFRYPGGKTWFVPYVRNWLYSLSKPARFVEPFGGGGIVSLTVAFEELARHSVLAELDDNIASVWKVMLNGKAEWLAKQILDFELTVDHAKAALSKKPRATHELAFQTILRNRVQRGGIMAPGAGLVKTGESGRGISSRWYPETLARRIRAINTVRHRLTFIHGDGMKLIDDYRDDADTVFYVDPPYTAAARRLYSHWDIDHRLLFQKLSKIRGQFLMSYDNTPEIAALAKEFGYEAHPIAMKNTHHAKMTELLIGRDLDWLFK